MDVKMFSFDIIILHDNAVLSATDSDSMVINTDYL